MENLHIKISIAMAYLAWNNIILIIYIDINKQLDNCISLKGNLILIIEVQYIQEEWEG